MEVLPSGVLFYGTELIPLFPYLRAGLLLKGEGGGGGGGRDRLTVQPSP